MGQGMASVDDRRRLGRGGDEIIGQGSRMIESVDQLASIDLLIVTFIVVVLRVF